ncbi:putative abhydrolase domain-containing protein [Abeliophyllum distichum]|uniref:Abhydrolase domain-containing protein n=1 Tax=Abeliophyllum distichum TaxID=126358 RepID=A0ABD1RD26_9LAMI
MEFFIPGPEDRVGYPPLGCISLNQVMLAVGLYFPFHIIIRKFLREWTIDLTHLCPNEWRNMVGFLILLEPPWLSPILQFENLIAYIPLKWMERGRAGGTHQ